MMQDTTPQRAATVRLPADMWRRAKQAALDENTSMRQLLMEGLEMRLNSLSAEPVRVKAGTHRTGKGSQ